MPSSACKKEMELNDLVECCGLLFRLPSLIKKCEELVRARDGLAPQCNRLRFLCRDRKVTAGLHCFLRARPPPLPFRFGEQIAHQHLADLSEGGFAVEPFQDVTNDCCRIRL